MQDNSKVGKVKLQCKKSVTVPAAQKMVLNDCTRKVPTAGGASHSCQVVCSSVATSCQVQERHCLKYHSYSRTRLLMTSVSANRNIAELSIPLSLASLSTPRNKAQEQCLTLPPLLSATLNRTGSESTITFDKQAKLHP